MSTRSESKPPVYGLIEWDASYTPTLIVGCCFDAVARTAVRILAQTDAGGGCIAADDPDFLTHHPLPDPADPDADIGSWLDALREATTQPWFTMLDTDEIVHTSDETILLNWTSAVPCISRPDGHHTDTTSDTSPQPALPPGAAIPPGTGDQPRTTRAGRRTFQTTWRTT